MRSRFTAIPDIFQDLGTYRLVAVSLPHLDALAAAAIQARAGLTVTVRLDARPHPDAEDAWDLDCTIVDGDGATVEPTDSRAAWHRIRLAFGLPLGADTRDLLQALFAGWLGASPVEVWDVVTDRWPTAYLAVPVEDPA